MFKEKNVVNNVDKSSLWAYRDIKKQLFFCFSDFSVFFFYIFNFQLLKGLLQKMLNYRLGMVN